MFKQKVLLCEKFLLDNGAEVLIELLKYGKCYRVVCRIGKREYLRDVKFRERSAVRAFVREVGIAREVLNHWGLYV